METGRQPCAAAFAAARQQWLTTAEGLNTWMWSYGRGQARLVLVTVAEAQQQRQAGIVDARKTAAARRKQDGCKDTGASQPRRGPGKGLNTRPADPRKQVRDLKSC